MSQSIVIIVHYCKDGSSVGSVAWHHVIELSRYFEVYVITCYFPNSDNHHIHPILLSPTTWNFLKRFCHVPNELSFQAAARGALKDLCEKTTISAVWCHSHGTVVLSALPLSKRYGFKILMTTHGDIFERPKGTYNYLLTFYYKWVTPIAYRSSHHVQALSPYMADWAIKNGTKKNSLSVIPNGIAPEDIGASKITHRKAETFLPNDVLRILFVGGLHPIKGVDYLIRAMAVLKSMKRRSTLICIGDGPERDNLQTLSKKLNLENDIEFLGNVPRNHLHAFYQKADVLSVPSISDTLPTVVLEAFVIGLPVVGANTGGIPYMLKNGQRGFLFEPVNLNSLVDVLVCAGKNRDNLSALSKECSFAAAHEFSWPSIGRLLRGIINTICS